MIVRQDSRATRAASYLEDRRIDGTALAVLVVLLSLVSGTSITTEELGKRLHWGRDRTWGGIKRLCLLGYVVRKTRRTNGNRFGSPELIIRGST